MKKIRVLLVALLGAAIFGQGLPALASSIPAKTRYHEATGYPGYVAVRFSQGGQKVRAVWLGDGPGFCFVGRRNGGTYRGTEVNLAGGSSSASYSRGELLGGQKVVPPAWFKRSSSKVFTQARCR